jgi:serine/threonine-protein kinase
MIGQSFGNYRALSLLGEGGMGAVYLAEHPEIGRKVAIKVLRPDYARDETLLGRFLNEARAANAIRHPNIIEILDSGTLADKTPFLVMELLEGESLAARIRRVGRLDVPVAVDFANQTASALAAAHAKGIVHRDLKPDNLFVVADPHDPARERIKVLDFGIAKLQQMSATDSVKTRTGTLMGTPIYMSPEQCRGTRAVDHRTDIYSLGVILYEMLIGHPPFVSEGFGDLVNMHINVAPVSPRSLRPEIPEALDALVMQMLAKTPEARFDGMPALRAALKESAGGAFLVHGSSPDLHDSNVGRTRAAAMPSSSNLGYGGKQTTLSSGTGEQAAYAARPKGRLMVAAAVAVVVLGGGAFALRGRLLPGGTGGDGTGKGTTASGPGATGPVAPTVPVTATTPPPSTTPPPPAAPAKITIVIESTPVGASVVATEGGARLGSTPLTLTRDAARGAALSFRIEKEGYLPVVRSVPLVRDETMAIELEKKPRPSHGGHRPSDEPAKL